MTHVSKPTIFQAGIDLLPHVPERPLGKLSRREQERAVQTALSMARAAEGAQPKGSVMYGAKLRRSWDVWLTLYRDAFNREGRRLRRPRATRTRAASADLARKAAGPPTHGLT